MATNVTGNQSPTNINQLPADIQEFLNLPEIKQSRSQWWFGQAPRPAYLPTYNTQQANAFSSILGQAVNQLQNVQNQPYKFDFNPIKQKAVTNFNQQTVPSIINRLSSLGGARSSGLQQSLGQAGANLNEGLAALESEFGLKQQALQGPQQLDLLRLLLGIGLQPQYQTGYSEGNAGALSNILSGLGAGLGGAGKGLGSALGQWALGGK